MSEEHDARQDDPPQLDEDFLDDADTEEPEIPDPDGEEPEETPPDEPRQNQGRETNRTWRNRARSAERQNQEYERRLAALETSRQAPAQPTFDPQAAAREEAQFRASLEQMMPAEIALAVADRQERKVQAQLFQAEIRGFDRHDVADFNRFRATNKAADRLAPEVERILNQRRQGGDFSLGRQEILAFLVGQEVLKKGPAAAARQRGQGAARVAAQRTNPGGGRGDVQRGGGGRSQDDADEAFLRGITTADI